VARLRRSICLEAVLAFAVIAATTALNNVPPPNGGDAMPDGHGSQTVLAKAASFDLVLTVVPARPGSNTLDLAVTSGGNSKDVMEVTLHLARPDLGIEEITRLMRHVGPGKYRLEGPELAVAGPWRVRIELLVSDFEKQSAEVLVTIGSTSGAHPAHS
jgi:copper transport protein